MRILVTNDDGINAPGLKVLQQLAETLSDDVWAIAPETDQSGAAHSLTLHEPLRCREVGERMFAVRGTPTDCVIMGVRHILIDKPPTLVLSGINCGSNLAEDVTYSGTVAGAMEGSLLGVRSIAMSLSSSFERGALVQWETPLALGPGIVRRLLETDFPADVFININYPDLPPAEVAGVAVTEQGRRDQGTLRIDARTDTWGNPYFWFGFERRKSDPAEGTDLWAISKGMISITPLYLNLTHAESCRALAGAFAAGERRPAKAKT